VLQHSLQVPASSGLPTAPHQLQQGGLPSGSRRPALLIQEVAKPALVQDGAENQVMHY
jgi:hypothetical protein